MTARRAARLSFCAPLEEDSVNLRPIGTETMLCLFGRLAPAGRFGRLPPSAVARSCRRIAGVWVLGGLLLVGAQVPGNRAQAQALPSEQGGSGQDGSSQGPLGQQPEELEAQAAEQAVRSMEELLDDAVSQPDPALGERATRRQPGRSGAVVPERPPVAELQRVVKRLAPAMRGCAFGASGQAELVIVLRSDGRVSSVKVSNPPFAGTPTARCMEGVLRRSRFPAFSLSRLRVRVPYVLE